MHCNVLKREFKTADVVPTWERIGTNCKSIDHTLHGGIPVNGITEIVGCSGAGKTQLCLQLSLQIQLPEYLSGKNKEVIYICTEDTFPSHRFHQLSEAYQAKYKLNIDFESNVFLRHIADSEQMKRCLTTQLPNFVLSKNIGIIIIDSIAGIFRSENENVNYSNRSKEFILISNMLNTLADKYNLAVVCTNQIAENVNNGMLEPCLGLAWSNLVTSRFNLIRQNHEATRQFEVVFAPDLLPTSCKFKIDTEGVTSAS